jgi:hypothetical protein
MELTTPQYSKAELLKLTAVQSTSFNNWRLRGLIPLKQLGVERVNLRHHTYSPLVAAYCRLLSFHKGTNRKQYIKCLNEIFEEVIATKEINEHLTIAINNFGTAADCGVFESSGLAMQICPRNAALIPAGQIIKLYTEDAKCQN